MKRGIEGKQENGKRRQIKYLVTEDEVTRHKERRAEEV